MLPDFLNAFSQHKLRCSIAVVKAVCILMILLCSAFPGRAYKFTGSELNDPNLENPIFDETSVFINVQRVGGTEVPAIIKDRMVYLPVTSVFDFLKIKNTPSAGFDSVSGFFIDPKAKFCIDNVHLQITYQGKVYPLKSEDVIQTESNLYMKQEYFNLVFGLTCSFDFSNLSVKISTKFDLPAVREMQMEQMHKNVSRLKGEIKADTTIRRKYPVFAMGIADWSVASSQASDGAGDLRLGLSLGSVLAGGEANVNINYNTSETFSERQQFYQWHFANNDHKALRQVTVGRIFAQTTTSVYDPIIGVQLTNTPTTYRKSFGTYRLSKTTQPGWTVELYVNNVMVDYTKADASGFFSFDVPLVYGNSTVKLRYYGLYGEERTSEENIIIPFNFLPKKELEYTVSAGIVEDADHSRFARAGLNYGLTKRITVGGGTEYFSSVGSSPNMPFVNASLRVTSNLMLSGDYTHGVRSRGMLTYRMPLNAQLELNYTKYAIGQKAIIYNFLEERRATLSLPIRARGFSMVSRLMFNQIVLTENTDYTTAEWLLSATVGSVSANISTNMMSAGQYDPPKFDPNFYTNAALSFRLPKSIILTPQAQYSFKDRTFISVKCEVEKYLFHNGFLNLSYEKNFLSNVYSIGGGLRFDLSFARVGVSSRQYNNVISTTESASGSLLYDSKTRFLSVSNRPSVGRAGITIVPYLDMNANGQRDEGEPRVAGLKVHVNGGRIDYSRKDTVVRLYDLEAYTNYYVDISQNSFENIGWQIRNKTMNVAVDPNQFKLIEVPVVVMAEGSGTVYTQGPSAGLKGQGRISVCFYRADGTQAGCTITESDGYFSFMGLTPGTYTVRPDPEQLNRLHMITTAARTITIVPSREGVMMEGLNFTISSTAPVEPEKKD